MIKAVFYLDGSLVRGFTISGHSEKAAKGYDVVCSAASSAAFMAANTVTETLNREASVLKRDGFMSFSLKHNDKDAEKVLSGLMLHLKELSNQYPDSIKIYKRGF